MTDDHLRWAYDHYMAAPLGELNATAEKLKQACAALGWGPDAGEGYLPWARRRLKVEIVYERKSDRR